MDCVLSWLITGIISAGVLGAALRGWGLAWRHLQLSEAQKVLSARVNTIEQSQKARVKWAKKDKDDEELEALRQKATAVKEPWEY